MIAQINVTDKDNYAAYVKQVLPTIERFGGEFLVRGGKSESFEGNPPGDRHVVIRFPGYQVAYDWYHSEDMRPSEKCVWRLQAVCRLLLKVLIKDFITPFGHAVKQSMRAI